MMQDEKFENDTRSLEGDSIADDDSIISVCLSAATLASSASPIKKGQELLEDRLHALEDHLHELREHRSRHEDIERAYEQAREEIFYGVDAVGGRGRRDKKGARTPRQLRVSNRLAKPKRVKGKIRTDGIAKTSHDWVVLRARETPGIHPSRPVGSTLDTRGGRFNMSQPLSDLEVHLLRAREEAPDGPNLLLPSTLNRRGMGRFSVSQKPATDTDRMVARAREMPSPQDYETEMRSTRITTGKFNTSRSKRHVDHMVHLATLNHGSDPLVLPSTLSRAGGTFNRSAKPLTERDWIVKRAKQTPGPGECKCNFFLDCCCCQADNTYCAMILLHARVMLPSCVSSDKLKYRDISDVGGGRISSTSVMSDVDVMIRRAALMPGPCDYRATEAMEASSQHVGAGKAGKFPFVFRPLDFESRHLAKGSVAEEKAWERRRAVVFKENPDGTPIKPKEKLKRAGNLIRNALRGMRFAEEHRHQQQREHGNEPSFTLHATNRSSLLRAIIDGNGGGGESEEGGGFNIKVGRISTDREKPMGLSEGGAFGKLTAAGLGGGRGIGGLGSSFADVAKNAMGVSALQLLNEIQD